MSQNPYAAPGPATAAVNSSAAIVRAPAISLIVVGGISLACLILSLFIDVVLLATHFASADNLSSEQSIEVFQVVFRMIWGVVILLASIVVVLAAISMLRLKRFGFAYTGAIVAAIPCLGPCCILGIPFGIWAMMTLNRPEVKAAFSPH